MISIILSKTQVIFIYLENIFKNKNFKRLSGTLIASIFLLGILAVYLKQMGLLPEFLAYGISYSYFSAIVPAFTLLLVFEAIELIFALSDSVSKALLKQFEIFSLILLRNAFKEFQYIEHLSGNDILSDPVFHMLSDASGSLIIFGLVLLISKLQKHKAITGSDAEQHNFIAVKQLVSLTLIVVFIGSAGYDWILFIKNRQVFDFFTNFYTVLIFTDILLVLISLRYSASYEIVYRNSAYAFATILIRLALASPPFVNSIVGICAGVFVLGVTYVYNKTM